MGCVMTVNYHYENQRAIATGAMLTGCGVAIMVMPIGSQALLDHYGFQGTLMLFAAIMFQGSIFAMFMKPHPNEILDRNQVALHDNFQKRTRFGAIITTMTTYKRLFRNKAFCLMNMSILLWSIGTLTNMMFLPDYFIVNGSTKMEASYLVSTFGVGLCIVTTVYSKAQISP